jgi:small subunit ribosomal protein S20
MKEVLLAHLKSSRKRIRTARKAHLRNVAMRSRLKTAVKKVRTASDPEVARKALSEVIPLLDRTAQKGILHANTAARHKSRLTRPVNRMAQSA